MSSERRRPASGSEHAPIPGRPAAAGVDAPDGVDVTPGLDADDIADRVLRAARGVPGVVDTSPGLLGEVATYLPGRRVPGVRVRDDRVELHLVIGMDAVVPTVVDLVRSALEDATSLRADIYIDDIATPAPSDEPAAPAQDAGLGAATPTIEPAHDPAPTH